MNYFDPQQTNNILNMHHNIIDLVITNLNCEVCHSGSPLVPEDSHHPALNITFQLTVNKNRDPK